MTSLVDWKRLSRQKSERVQVLDDELKAQLDLLATIGTSLGVPALSLPQIGITRQAFVLAADEPIVILNPTVLAVSTEMASAEEVCPNYPNTMFKITRPTGVRLRYMAGDGKYTTNIYKGLTAMLVFQMLDFLGGTTPLDRVSPLKRELIVKRLNKHDRRSGNVK